ncbi:PCNA-associated factor isoform X2 [Hydra vulgaris]|uniref:PCNA-associated factor isoform X2 n=1 Tax=Hydra vulgaris TaxID=6087 RepID=A0ABM4DAC7_HYDVU
MVRTRAENSSRKAVAAKAPRKSLGGESNGGSSMGSCYDSSSKNGNSFPLINHAKMWPTPAWQKGIKSFFSKNENYEADTSCGCSSSGSVHTQDDITEPTTLVTENASNKELTTEDKENLLPSSGSSLTLSNTSASSSSSSSNTSASSSSSSSSSTKGASKINSKKKRRVVMDDESD